jgi:hypothetical protein
MNAEIKKTFVSFEVAKLMDEKQYNGECLAFFDEYGELNLSGVNSIKPIKNSSMLKGFTAPTWEQAEYFLMSKGIYLEQHHFGGDLYQFKICKESDVKRTWTIGANEMIHIKAKERAIIEALNLI